MSTLSKQRTREHIIADLSVNYAELHFLRAGYAINRVFSDYGYDLIINTFDDTGHLEPGAILVQLKASDAPDYSQAGDFVTVRVDDRDDATWRKEKLPVVLVIYDVASHIAYAVHYQSVLPTMRRSVRIPTTSRLDESAARQFRAVKMPRFRRLL